MRPIAEFPADAARRIRAVVTDIDDTLTDGARLPAETYAALARLKAAGLIVIPASAAPAGWCDAIARMWPIDGIVGENGGLFFRHDGKGGATLRRYWLDEAERRADRARLGDLAAEVSLVVSGAALAHDDRYRETTLAMTAPSPRIDDVLAAFRRAGARATRNSLWALAWYGEFDKLAMIRRVLADEFAIDIDRARAEIVYAGDSTNDGPQFAFFPNSVGVSTVTRWLSTLEKPPAFVTKGPGGAGFVELADALVAARR
jgi:3-deoxy-D-manno-octulosonate 8-phosphate phosphatase KdsC-like HAD superfamily phosphatase